MDNDNRNNDRENIDHICDQLKIHKKVTKDNLDHLSKQEVRFDLMKQVYETKLPDKKELSEFFDPLSESIQFARYNIDKFKVADISKSMEMMALASVAGTSMSTLSVASVSYIEELPPDLVRFIQVEASGEHEKNKEKIARFLNKISPDLKVRYEGAWDAFNTTTDPRNAIASFREIIRAISAKFVPNDIKGEGAWELRIKHIAVNFSKDNNAKNLLTHYAKSAGSIVQSLSKFKDTNRIEKNEIKAILIRAEDLLVNLAENIDLNKLK